MLCCRVSVTCAILHDVDVLFHFVVCECRCKKKRLRSLLPNVFPSLSKHLRLFISLVLVACGCARLPQQLLVYSATRTRGFRQATSDPP